MARVPALEGFDKQAAEICAYTTIFGAERKRVHFIADITAIEGYGKEAAGICAYTADFCAEREESALCCCFDLLLSRTPSFFTRTEYEVDDTIPLTRQM